VGRPACSQSTLWVHFPAVTFPQTPSSYYETTARLETSNLRTALAPHIHNTCVLHLGCGTGYYSFLFLEWGVAYVLGVDISPVMIGVAEESLASSSSSSSSFSSSSSSSSGGPARGQLEFQVGDARCLGRVGSMSEVGVGGFGIVVGAWVLPYAANGRELEAMFGSVAENLKVEGGVFVGIVTPVVGWGGMEEYKV